MLPSCTHLPHLSAPLPAALSSFMSSRLSVSKSQDIFNAFWRTSLSFRLIMIWSLTAISSAVQSTDVHLKLQCLASSNMRLQKAINVPPSSCMFDQKIKLFRCYILCGHCFYKSHQCAFCLVFSFRAAIHQSVYSLLDEYITRNLETFLRDFVCSQISSNCSNDGFWDAFSVVAAVIFHHSIAASKEILLEGLDIMHRTAVENIE